MQCPSASAGLAHRHRWRHSSALSLASGPTDWHTRPTPNRTTIGPHRSHPIGQAGRSLARCCASFDPWRMCVCCCCYRRAAAVVGPSYPLQNSDDFSTTTMDAKVCLLCSFLCRNFCSARAGPERHAQMIHCSGLQPRSRQRGGPRPRLAAALVFVFGPPWFDDLMSWLKLLNSRPFDIWKRREGEGKWRRTKSETSVVRPSSKPQARQGKATRPFISFRIGRSSLVASLPAWCSPPRPFVEYIYSSIPSTYPPPTGVLVSFITTTYFGIYLFCSKCQSIRTQNTINNNHDWRQHCRQRALPVAHH